MPHPVKQTAPLYGGSVDITGMGAIRWDEGKVFSITPDLQARTLTFAGGANGYVFDGLLPLTHPITLTETTSATGAYTGIYTTITTGLTHTGNVAGIRSIVQTDNTGDSIANIFALMSKAMLRHESDVVTGTMTALLAQIDLGSVSNSNAANAWGICVDMLETGTRAKIPVAFMRFVDKDYAGAAPTNYLFDLGATGNEFPSGTTKIHYGNTLWFRLNSTDKYLLCGDAEYGWHLGTSGSKVTVTAGTPIMSVYSTCASTGTDGTPVKINHTLSAAGGVGVGLQTDVGVTLAGGNYVAALYGVLTFATGGRITGIASGVVGEVVLSAGTTPGTYCGLNSELVANSEVSTGAATSFIYMNIGGDNSTGKTTINTNGYLFQLGAGVVDTAGGIFEAEVNTDSMSMTHVLKILIGGTPYYIPLNTAKTF